MRTQCLCAILVATPALAQSSVIIDVDEPTLLPGQSTTVTLSAAFPTFEYAMAGIATDLLSSVGATGWSDVSLVTPMDGPGTSIGVPTSDGFERILAGQLNFGPAGFEPSLDNPIAFWQATYTAPVDPTRAFEVDLSTMTSRFEVYIMPDSHESRAYLDDLVEGSATIHVIPAPAGASVLALGLAAGTRRRR
ncbi:MAG: hypothetical protein NCW75_01670 [Phycisphaera sp.]|nr:MAG: hypothetical protein NCW75_01670 [Phycisphaera sp.]